MTQCTLTLVRHGQSEGNSRNIFTGLLDLPLTEAGEAEARQAGLFLRQHGVPVAHAFTSELSRAQKSCRIVLDQLSITANPACSSALNERDYGELSGLNKDEARQRWGSAQVHLWRRSYTLAPPGGESLRDTAARVLSYFIHDILPATLAGGGSLVVAHGNSLRALVMALDGLTPEEIEHTEIATGEILIYRLDENARVQGKEVHHA